MINKPFGVLWHSTAFRYSLIQHSRKQFSNMNRLFENTEHADLYNKFRPLYPSAVMDEILAYHNEICSGYKFALDVGCGSGQSTLSLSRYFKSVTGIDVSEAQISQAPNNLENVKFMVGQAEDLSFCKDSSVNLITVAQAMHWMDTNQFYASAKRVLEENGVLAVYGYGNMSLDIPEANHIISKEFYQDCLQSGGYWNEKRRHIDIMYSEFTLPFKDFRRLEDGKIHMEKYLSLPDLIGYIKTWSGYQEYMKKHPSSDILENIAMRVKEIYELNQQERPIKIKTSWPIYMLLGRK